MYHICAVQYPAWELCSGVYLSSACQQPCFWMRRWNLIVSGVRESKEPQESHNYQHHLWVFCSEKNRPLLLYFCNAPNTPNGHFGKLSSDKFGKVDYISSVGPGDWSQDNWPIGILLSWQLVDPERVFNGHIAFCLTHGMLLDMNTIAFLAQPAANWQVSDKNVLRIIAFLK